jgi:serine phosphatase RsbU (regulator of sigma subunit)/anti-sigma regulatory factor (Ser/Thr protein kinase)
MRHLRVNAAMCRMLGLDAEAAILGRRLTDLTDSPQAESCVDCGRMVARTGEPAVWRGMSGPASHCNQIDPHVWQATLSPVKDPADRVIGVLMVALDMTQQHVARQRLALVNEAASRIGSTLDITRTAQELVEVTVPRFADFATVDLLDAVIRGDEPVAGPVAGDVRLRRMACGSVLPGIPESMVQPGQVTAYAQDSPTAGCLATGRPVRVREAAAMIARWRAEDPDRAARMSQHGVHSILAVPVLARGAVLGIATFIRHQRAEPFEDDDLMLAQEIVARAAVCIDNARRYTREHATALALQRSLLQRRQPEQAAVEVATRYLPAQSGVAVGGDWFDVIRLSGSRIALVVGDVVGHGIHAAATMGRLRTAVRTLADIDPEPDELLTRLDDVVTRLAAEEGLLPSGGAAGMPAGRAADLSATCLYAVYDPVSRRCTLARAGHPLPALVTPDGRVTFLDMPAGPPLGLGGLPFEQAEVELAEGSLLVLYTDGLIESRQRDIGAGLDAMREVLTQLHAGQDAAPGLEDVCDQLVEELLPAGAGDDAALLVARTRAIGVDKIVSWELPAEPAIVAQARARAARQLHEWGLDDIAFTTELVVSELVTNAIRHAQPPIQLRMILDGMLFCEVSDSSNTEPHLRRADRYDEGGRGLMLVAQLADRWGSRHTRAGKTIWAQQPLPQRPSE